VPRRRSDAASAGSTDPVSVRIDVAMSTGSRFGRGGGGQNAAGTATAQHSLLMARRGLSNRDVIIASRLDVTTRCRDVISTRAIGPAFHR